MRYPISLVALFYALSACEAQPLYRVIDLGNANAYGLSSGESAWVAGEISDTGKMASTFRWQNPTVKSLLQPLGSAPGTYTSFGSAVNERGYVTVQAFSGSVWNGYIYDPQQDTFAQLLAPGDPSHELMPLAINDANTIVGYGVGPEGAIGATAYRYAADPEARSWLPLANAFAGGVAIAINNEDVVTGWSRRLGQRSHAMVWRLSGDSVAAEDLSSTYELGVAASGTGINELGDVVGNYTMPGSNQQAFAVIAGEVFLSIDPSDRKQAILALNDERCAVGFSDAPDAVENSQRRALLWDLNGNLFYDLNTRLAGDAAGEWQLRTALAINARGEILVDAWNLLTQSRHSLLLIPDARGSRVYSCAPTAD